MSKDEIKRHLMQAGFVLIDDLDADPETDGGFVAEIAMSSRYAAADSLRRHNLEVSVSDDRSENRAWVWVVEQL